MRRRSSTFTPLPGYEVKTFDELLRLLWDCELQAYAFHSLRLIRPKEGFPIQEATKLYLETNNQDLRRFLYTFNTTWPRHNTSAIKHLPLPSKYLPRLPPYVEEDVVMLSASEWSEEVISSSEGEVELAGPEGPDLENRWDTGMDYIMYGGKVHKTVEEIEVERRQRGPSMGERVMAIQGTPLRMFRDFEMDEDHERWNHLIVLTPPPPGPGIGSSKPSSTNYQNIIFHNRTVVKSKPSPRSLPKIITPYTLAVESVPDVTTPIRYLPRWVPNYPATPSPVSLDRVDVVAEGSKSEEIIPKDGEQR